MTTAKIERFRLDDRVAIVTGACGKLGPIWTGALLDAGARVAAFDLPGAVASPAFEALAAQYGPRLARVPCDITSRPSIEGAAADVARQFGAVDVLVNNAGVDQPPDSAGTRS